MDEAIEKLCAKSLHRSLWLPENSLHQRLRVTFSTTSNFPSTQLPVALFCTPMFGSRWNNVGFDHLASLYGIRVICIDRPGMGGSTSVPLNIRIQVWLEAVQAVLKYLDVGHISLLFSHSAGTMYALNTLFHLRDILDSKQGHVAFIAPWVHNDKSHATLMNIASNVPNGMIDSFHSLTKFINTKIMPVTSWSGGLVSTAVDLLQISPSGADTDSSTPGERYGTNEETGKEIEKLLVKYAFAEDLTSANEDAKLCLKKGGPGGWGVCEDYEEYVRMFVKQEVEKKQSHPSEQDTPKLQVHAYFAESDVMIGKGGQKYFEQCWRQDGVGDVVDFTSTELPGTNHDSALIDLKKGAVENIFKAVKGSI